MNNRGFWASACLAYGLIGAASQTVHATPRHHVSAPAGPAEWNESLQPGTRIAATLDHRISTKHSHTGDPFTATVSTPVYGPHGKLAIPAGSVVRGHVTAVYRGRGRDGESQLSLAVDGIRVGSAWAPIRTSVLEYNRDVWRGGARSREHSELRVGSHLVLTLQSPLTVAELQREFPRMPIGGGPSK